MVAMVTCAGSPVLFNRIFPPQKEKPRRGVIVPGTDFLAERLGKRLLQHGKPVTFIGRDATRLETLQEAGRLIGGGNGGKVRQ